MSETDNLPATLIDWQQYAWLLSQGVPPTFMVTLSDLPVVRGAVVEDRYFDLDTNGQRFLVFEENDDIVFWSPAGGELATWHNRAFALGADNIVAATTYTFDGYLTIHASPLDWLRDRCQGIVVLNWNLAFDLLRDAPRVAVAETILPLYREHMKPSHLPALSVLASSRSIAA